MSVETELKLFVPPRMAARLVRHPAIERHAKQPASRARVLSIYYDTPSFDLWSAGVALRLRRTVAGWVQTIKWSGSVLGALHQRGELEVPVPEQRLDLDIAMDPALAAKLAGSRLRRRLKPVFVTEFERTTRILSLAEETTAELSLDRGHVVAGTARAPICELELELGAGRIAALFDLVAELEHEFALRPAYRSKAERGYLLAGLAMAPVKAQAVALTDAMSIAESVAHIVASGLVQLQANEDGMLAGTDPEYLHQARVAVRRLRSFLGAYARVLPSEPFDPLKAELKWLGTHLGPARDWDVFSIEMLPPLRAGLAEAAAVSELERGAEALRRAAARSALLAVRSRRFARLLLALSRIAATEGWRAGAKDLGDPVKPFADRLLDRRLERVLKQADGKKKQTAAQLHALRIAVKKLRYAVEFFSGIYPGEQTKSFRDCLTQLQDCLGAINDATSMRALARLAVPSTGQLDDIVTGWSLHMIHAERVRLRELWRAFRREHKFWN